MNLQKLMNSTWSHKTAKNRYLLDCFRIFKLINNNMNPKPGTWLTLEMAILFWSDQILLLETRWLNKNVLQILREIDTNLREILHKRLLKQLNRHIERIGSNIKHRFPKIWCRKVTWEYSSIRWIRVEIKRSNLPNYAKTKSLSK